MKRFASAFALLGLAVTVLPFQAQANTPRAGLRFANLEFAMPTDPMLGSADPGWQAHHTPASMLAAATDRIRAAVPSGTLAGDAAAMLVKAGARCAAPAGSAMVCRFHDVETPPDGDRTAWDAVTWTVTLSLADGRVADLAVARDWTRR